MAFFFFAEGRYLYDLFSVDNSVNETGLGLDERDVLGFFLTLSTVKYAKWSEIYLVTLKRNEVVFP